MLQRGITNIIKPLKGQRLLSTSRSLLNSTAINCGLLLSRVPLITKDPTSFEKTYWEYFFQEEERNSLPFPAEMYFKKGSLNERKWKEYQASRSQEVVEESVTDDLEEASPKTDEADEGENIFSNEYKANPRVTEADTKNDIKSLERCLDKHLYLLVKPINKSWQFPESQVQGEESLVEASQRQLEGELGQNLDHWSVGVAPVCHIAPNNLFLMKSHILGGQVSPDPKKISEFAWVNASEISTYLSPEHYSQVKDVLSL